MKHQLKLLFSIAIIVSLSMGCQKANIKPSDQINQTNPATSGGLLGKCTKTPTKSNSKTASDRRAKYLNNPNSLRETIKIKQKEITRKSNILDFKSSVISSERKYLAKKRAFCEDLIKALAEPNAGSYEAIAEELYKKTAKEIKRVESEISASEQIYKADKEKLELDKQDLKVHQELLTDIEYGGREGLILDALY